MIGYSPCILLKPRTDHPLMSKNRLAGASSPYLQQHAGNPVDWYPWGPEALELARQTGRPILLSIGYSACHWCHVMAHESFEDSATAAVMNELFVNIKVDREERPDLDRIYQMAQQMLTQRAGGWPLTMFLTHDDQRPFFGGTYFPKAARHGLPAFIELLRRVSEYYREQATEVRTQGAALIEALHSLTQVHAQTEVDLDRAPLVQCRIKLQQLFDRSSGGFESAPKFPHPTRIERLLRDWRATAASNEPDLQALYMATLTLRRMADGGLRDQIGGGFFRYSVDRDWVIPHFEKMLYDNGALLAVYAEALLATGDAFFGHVASDTAEWLMREMQLPDGGFCSSLDADSEGHEGRFYVWQREQLRALLSPAQFTAVSLRFGVEHAANFEGREWHLSVAKSIEQVATESGLSSDATEALLESARMKLRVARNQRIPPARDDKILTSWNAITLRGMAIAARALRRDDLGESANRALTLIRSKLWRNGRLLATCRDGRAELVAYLDDYVLLAEAILELAQLRWRSDEIAFAGELLNVVLAQFENPDGGGFYFTPADHEALIHRPMSFSDDATPAGNGVAALVLQRLGYLLADTRYLGAAERALRASMSALRRFPHAHTSMLKALEEYLDPVEILILRGEAAEISRWQRELQALYAPRRLILAIPSDAVGLPAALAAKIPRGRAVAYLCQGSQCSAPIDRLDQLARNLRLGLGPSE